MNIFKIFERSKSAEDLAHEEEAKRQRAEEEAEGRKEREAERRAEKKEMAQWREANPEKASWYDGIVAEAKQETKWERENDGKRDPSPLGGALGQTIRAERNDALRAHASLRAIDNKIKGILTSDVSKPPPSGWEPIDYRTNQYVGIFDTYEPISKSFQKSDFKPLEFEEFNYEPYVHEPVNIEQKKYEPRVWEPMEWIPSEWTPSEYDELEYKPMDNSQPPYVSPIIDPQHVEVMPNELTPNDGDILYDGKLQTWRNSPLFNPTGLGDELFGKKVVESQALVDVPNAPHPLSEDLGVREYLAGLKSKPPGMSGKWFGMYGEQQKPWESSPVFVSTGLGSNLFGKPAETTWVKPMDVTTPSLPTTKIPEVPRSRVSGIRIISRVGQNKPIVTKRQYPSAERFSSL